MELYVETSDWNGNQHAPSETDMPDQQPIGDRHAWSETDMPDQRPTYMPNQRHIGQRHA